MRAVDFEGPMQKAVVAFDAGFAAEARRKEALAQVNRAFEAVREIVHQALLGEERGPEPDYEFTRPNWNDLYYDFPNYPNLWKPKHDALYAEWPEQVAQAKRCIELRDAIRAAQIAPKPVREDHPLLAMAKADARKIWEQIEARAEKQRQDYEDTLDLGRKLAERAGAQIEFLPVSVHRVFCANYAGSEWLRLDWYLRGRRVAFNVIAGAYDQLIREGVIKP